jgi:lysozyme
MARAISELLTDLMRDETCRLHAYQDSAGAWTIGYGHTGRTVHPGLAWTNLDAFAALVDDVDRTCAGLDSALPWWRSLDEVRQDALSEMAFSLGIPGLLGSVKFLEHLKAGEWALSSASMLMSKWSSQVGDRAQRLSLMIRDGVRAPLSASSHTET